MIVIIGAGLSGLACARTLMDAGLRPDQLVVLDRGHQTGGRVATDHAPACTSKAADQGDAYLLDRGFQVLLSGYPTARRLLDFDALDMRWFDSGALLAKGGGVLQPWYAPTRHPLRGLRSLFSRTFPFADQLRLARLMARWVATPENRLLERLDGRDLAGEFNRNHLGIKFKEEFLLPFYGGVLLDDNLATSAALGALYGKRFALGRAGIPRAGMGAIPRQIASRLPTEMLRMDTEVVALEHEGGQPVATLADGSAIRASKVVLATDPWASARFLGLDPPQARSVAAVYFASDRPVYRQKLLLLLPGRQRWVRHAAQISNINPEAAPVGRHLFCATVLQVSGDMSDEEVFDRTLRDLAGFLPRSTEELEPLRVVRVPRALPVQSPGWSADRVKWHRACPPGVILAGDAARNASIEGVLAAGVGAATRLLKDA